ncbi:MAG: hypothetical protein A3F70_12155 [Acidobacteria bacterium RIFCSPLOWO2_12_FULL_67_14]|nr:MAG: hypothetical protein A3H29_09705 [Acidobacteria bacterium RIFCSPLOWO2_02_FULL_67_21]OFW36114.1 MAG: hypothetical protein A3F70_12155 [Acidobacteria bacterium RIFCSPLOWO2_12_FULL_67_14]
MSPKLEIAKRRIQRAHDTLKEGDLLIAARHWRGALNRVYYAAFYAARALLATQDLDAGRHSGVIALFQQHFVKTGIVPANVAKALPYAFEARQTSDYADVAEPGEEEVNALQMSVRAFVAACARFVEQQIVEEK